MKPNDLYLAIFLGSPAGVETKAWKSLSDAERRAKEQAGIAAWQGWMEKHHAAIVENGGPLGKTKRISQAGVTNVVNALTAYVVVRAASHEAAAQMFEGHPHFTIFPGEAVEVMPLLPIPGA
jgi:hypothetical protein